MAMGHPAEELVVRATYADLEAAPPNRVAELITGVLHVFPRPAPRHARASSTIGVRIGGAFDLGDGGPGGWWILDEPELHFPDPTEPGAIDALVPDIAGWRRERMPKLPKDAHFTLAPDWVCEVLSKSTTAVDRAEKMPIYAREGVRYAWLVEPVARTLEVFVLSPERRWILDRTFRGNDRARAAPFDEVALDLSLLWIED